MWNLCWVLVVLLVDWCFSFFFLNISVVCNYGVFEIILEVEEMNLLCFFDMYMGLFVFRKKIGAWHVGILMNEPILFLIIEYLLMISNSGQYKCKKGISYCFMPVGAHCCSHS